MGRLNRFIAASGLTNLADGIGVVAWAWLASLVTRDALLISVVPFMLRLPWFLLALPAGVVTDRVDRRRLILTADVVRGAAFCAVAVAILAEGALPPAPDHGVSSAGLFLAMLAAAITVGAAEVFRDNAAQTMLPALVSDPSRLERANGRLWSVEMVGNALAGPALGAALIPLALALPFTLNALAYLAAVAIVAGIPGGFRPRSEGPRDFRAELSEGFAFLRSVPLLRVLALVTGSWNLVFQIAFVALVLHVQENLGLGAQTYGLVLAGGAVGGIAGASMAERAIARLGPGRVAQITLTVPGFAFLGLALAPNAWALGAVYALFEFSGIIWNVVSVSFRQRRIPDRLFGRVNSLYRLLAWGMIPLGSILSGLIVRSAESVMPRGWALEVPFYVGAAGSLMIAAVAWRSLGRGFSTSS